MVFLLVRMIKLLVEQDSITRTFNLVANHFLIFGNLLIVATSCQTLLKVVVLSFIRFNNLRQRACFQQHFNLLHAVISLLAVN
jgi:hypothetical protein